MAIYKSKYTGSQIDKGIRPYKVLSAKISQAGVNAPVLTIMENDFTSIVTAYQSVGSYHLRSLNKEFTIGKTIAFITNGTNADSGVTIRVEDAGDEYLYISVRNPYGSLADSTLTLGFVEVRVYT